MRKRLSALFLVALVWLAGCANTAEGLRQDANKNIDKAQQEINNGDDDGG